MNSRRVVITGLGPITPIGIGREEFWKSLVEGKTNFSEITRFPLSNEDKCRVAAQIPDKYLDIMKMAFDMSVKNSPRVSAGLERSLIYAFNAADAAVTDANITKKELEGYKTGVIIGDTNSDFILPQLPASIRTVPYLLSNSLSGVVASYYKIEGFSTSISGACATGNHAVRIGFKEIRDGDADIMLVGASSAPIQRPHFYDDFSDPILKDGVMSKSNDLKYAMKPFSEKRDGFVLSEGAGVLVLEELEHAKSRGANIYAEVLGYGDSTKIENNFLKTSKEGYENAMAKAVKMVENTGINLQKSRVYINAHGTATKLNDLIETNAINDTRGLDLVNIVASSIKGFTGHSQGAASAIELIASALTLKTGIIPGMPWIGSGEDIKGNINYQLETGNFNPDIVLKNAAGFFGVYSTIALGRVD